MQRDFNPRVPWGTRRAGDQAGRAAFRISIHASRGGRDELECTGEYDLYISIHASRGGRDGDAVPRGAALLYFNPRVPWGTRRGHRGEHPSRRGDFNPRVPWGTRPISSLLMSLSSYFNPRVPWGTRPGRCVYGCPYTAFQSTRPVGDATKELSIRARKCRISIHASRGGRDTTTLTCQKLCTVFQSTRPVGDATAGESRAILRSTKFQSTRPVGDATVIRDPETNEVQISIHASRGGRDYKRTCWNAFRYDFNPRVPWGTRQQHCTIYELYNAAYPPILYLEVTSFLPTTSPSIHIFLKSFSFKGANHIGNL